ncbi:Major facilitator superfamily domain, general substrate transporter [Teratosphaeria destructans]|uniref:Major facilitator superfamily domain, general substrate transporter n=1 Tax=Teratosphaeria destructans TaxID=418781 RepID=A0A9W7SM05_9PEZI|nr:Major facilitator superfamily domain, general substrate transporter [Teratosphaeria destructans]
MNVDGDQRPHESAELAKEVQAPSTQHPALAKGPSAETTSSAPDSPNEKVTHDSEVDRSVVDEDAEPVVTLKTWIVCFILSIGYGLSFWCVPVVSAIGSELSASWGEPSGYVWYVPAWTIAITVSFLWFGPKYRSAGKKVVLVAATAKSNGQMIAGLAIIGFGGALCQCAAFALPELLPNKWRHIGVVFADAVVYITVILAPVTARYGYRQGHWWANFAGLACFQFLSFLGLLLLYFPPAHPSNMPAMQAFKELDYVGMLLFAAGAVPVLMGIVWAGVYDSSDAHVVAPLVVGFVILLVFAVWETWVPKHPLTPRRILVSSWGRDFTAPAIALGVVNMFYYSSSIVYPEMITLFWTDGGAEWKKAVVLSLPQGFAITTGALLLTFLGGKIKHWQWQLFGASFVMVLFGALMGLVTPTNKGTMIAFCFLSQMGFGYAIYLAIALSQLGVEQKDLGIAGGLSGTFRFAAGAIATSVYTTVLNNSLADALTKNVPPAAEAAGVAASQISKLMAAISASTYSTEYSASVVAAITPAIQNSYCHAIYMVCMTSLGFGLFGLLCCAYCKDVDRKMNNKIEVYLENTKYADRNKYH